MVLNPTPQSSGLDAQAGLIPRRRLLHLGVAGLTLLSLPVLSDCSSAPPLQIALQPWCGYQFMKLAYQQGWISNEHIQLMETTKTSQSVAALRSGQVDAAALTLDEILRLRDEGMDLSVVMVFDISAGADVLLTRPGLTTLADLRGKRIGVENSSLGEIMLARILQVSGLQRTDIIVVKMEEDHVLAWQRDQLDAVITYDPSRTALLNLGLSPLFDSSQLPLLILDMLAVRKDVLDSKGEAVRELIAGHFYALQQWQENPIDISYQLAPLLSVDGDSVYERFKGLNLPDLLYNRHYFDRPMLELNTAASEVAQIMSAAGMLKNTLVPDGLFDGAYLPEETK